MIIQDKVDRLIFELRQNFAGFEIVPKETNSFMKGLNFFVRIFNKEFLTRYITTVYPKIYWPASKVKELEGMLRTLSHEAVHLSYAKKRTRPVSFFLYLFPQSLILLSLLSILTIWFGPWWLLNLGWLLCLAPLPAYFRMREELEAYTMSIAVYYWLYGPVPPSYVDEIARHFYTSNYYFMWPFKKHILKLLHENKEKVIRGEYDSQPLFGKVKQVVQQ